jgi:benzylsuccinate CoA-transferase BbsF subunit
MAVRPVQEQPMASNVRPLTGVRVADFSWIGVGPLGTKHLADAGAEVIRIESTTRPDTLRRAGPFPDGVEGLERSAHYYNLNTSKLGLALNLNHPRARELARRLVAVSDVVVESFTTRVMTGWQLAYEDLRQVRPDIIMLSASMEGRTGPHKDYLGFGTALQSTAGITWLTGWPDRGPLSPGTAYTDWVVPYYVAFAILSALEYHRRTGRGQWIDLSQLEAGIHSLESALLDYGVNGRSWSRAGNALLDGACPRAVPHGAYRCRGDDRWIAIAVLSDADWQALVQAIGCPAWACDPALAALEGRIAQQEMIDQRLEEWTGCRDAAEVMHTLQAAGVAAGVVQNQQDVAEDPQLAHRGHSHVVDHPDIGPQLYDGPSYRLSKSPSRLGPVPLFGQHNDYVIRDLLGMDEDEYAACWGDGVFE